MKKLLIFTTIVFGSFWFDPWFIEIAKILKGTTFGNVLLLLTDTGVITYVFMTLYFFLIERRFYTIILTTFALAVTFEAGSFLKILTQIPRPYAGDDIFLTLGSASGFSFPSNHAALVFCLFAFTIFVFKKHQHTLFALAAFFALTRAFTGVHYFSDVVGGAAIGFYIGNFIIQKAENKKFKEKLITHIKDKLELRRQIAHIITGFSIILLVRYNLLSLEALLVILIIGGVLSYSMRKRDLPFFTPVLRWFEREKYIKKFPGRGSFFFVLGSFLSLLFFTQNIAFAAIAIMAVGDAVNNIVGTYFGRVKIFYNTKKHIEGLVVAVVAATIAAVNFVPLWPAVLASTVALIVETIPFKYQEHEIDDNIIIPLVAGGILSLL